MEKWPLSFFFHAYGDILSKKKTPQDGGLIRDLMRDFVGTFQSVVTVRMDRMHAASSHKKRLKTENHRGNMFRSRSMLG